jgi:Holliday junction resolvase RusA-like endonuclease
MQAYRQYKQRVQLAAKAAGLQLPMRATRGDPVDVSVRAFFADGRHCDCGNVQKGVCDALFYGGSGDKHTSGSFSAPQYDAANPRVEVTVQVPATEKTRG